jgi:O-antigen/teichoic acid export membrane protein
MVFVAMEADFFPRLSAACNDTTRSNKIINQQMEICVLLIAPILICFVLSMPYMVKILYSDKFMAAVPMSISATLFMFFRALTLPVAYLPLAKGDSKMFMATELFYDIFIAVAVPFAFKNYGLLGAGWAISAGGFMYFVIIHTLYRFKYKFIFSPRLLYIYISQFVLLITTIIIALYVNGSSPELFKAFDIFNILGQNDIIINSKLHPSMTFVKWGVGLTTLSISLYLSLRILRKETNIISTIKTKIKSKIGAHE